MAKAAGILPASRNPSAPEGSVKPAPPPNPPKAQEVEALQAEVDFLGSVIATHAADTREYQKRISQAEAHAERLAEALALLPDDSGMVEYNSEEGSIMFCCGREVRLDWVHGPICTHDEDCWYARMRALRDDMSKGYNHHEEVE